MMKALTLGLMSLLFVACQQDINYDAQGTFEATEITLAAEATGKIMKLEVEEGDVVKTNQTLAVIDSTQLHWQRQQLVAQQSALLSSRPNTQKQVAALRLQLEKQKKEQQRVSNLLREGAATQKQLDDIETQVGLTERQLEASLSTLSHNTAHIEGNALAIEAQIAAINDRISKCRLCAPVQGIVLTKYGEAGEYTQTGKPLLKIADMKHLFLRAYFTSDQLGRIKVGDTVTVTANFGGEERYDYAGKIVWIASESEFTPKTIQTQDSRADLVYAVKIAVKNDGRLKIGLAGEVKL